jgi:hypothetical protein
MLGVIPNLPVTGLSVTMSLTCTLVMGCNSAWCDSKPPCDWFVCDNERTNVRCLCVFVCELNMYTCDGMRLCSYA